MRQTIQDRFWSKVNTSGGCWMWTASLRPNGYGQFSISFPKRKNAYSHRYAYEEVYGQIPEGLEIDHLCRNRACVNPSHLEAVTHKVNVLRGESVIAKNAARTHCAKGLHLLTEANRRYRKANSHWRTCLECSRTNKREYKQRLREQSLVNTVGGPVQDIGRE